MMEKENDIELRSEEFQEILGAVPHWILRWGIIVMAAVVLVLLVGSAIFKYPDVIFAQITVTGLTPPASIVARSSGKIRELYAKDNQEVGTGDYLAVIDNPAQTEDVLKVKTFLQDSGGRDTLPPADLKLGDLQSVYASFRTALFNYGEHKRLLYYPQKIEITKQRIEQYEVQYENLQKQYKLINEQTALQEKQYRRDIALNKTGVVSTEELEKSRAQYLQSELSRENMKSTLNNMRIQIGQLKESLLDTRHQDTETLNQLQTSLQTLENQLKTAIEEWELTYVLKAPIDGKVTFTSYWTVNQNVTAGSEVFAVVLIPGSSSFFIGKALLPIARSGKVKEGQRVNIHLDNFPDTEFGTLKGTVKNISKVAVKEANGVYYTVEIALPDGLKTTYRKELPNLPDLQGHADIVTEDVSLLERFFLPIKKILRENN